MQKVVYKDLGRTEYQAAWDYQESLLQENVRAKTVARQRAAEMTGDALAPVDIAAETTHYLLFVEHPPVYTLGKSGHMENVLIGAGQMEERGCNSSGRIVAGISPFMDRVSWWGILFSIWSVSTQILDGISGTWKK
ncbi:hypothetical protein ACQ86N_09850 [Puia sp. P3]|uniref:hypothetical protein n=1 Tax=Puia sp. P3 TaxID=3423952 RepID=UPI003D66DEF0